MTATTDPAGTPAVPAPLEMNPQIRARWVAELRSGRRKQGRGKLRTADDGLCCMGVLCELAVEDGVIPPPVQSDSDSGYWLYDQCSNWLPPSVTDWAGLSASNPKIGADALSFLNDGDRDPDTGKITLKPRTFAQIADLIDGGAR